MSTSHYVAEVVWERGDDDFLDLRYRRRHTIRFDGGVEIPGSPSPHIVPAPLSDATAVDPEELFVASLSSCHMLWFLHLAAKRGFRVDRYTDPAEGVMGKNPQGRLAMTRVTLRPDARFSGDRIPSAEEIAALHHEAHEACFIANSVTTAVDCMPVMPVLP